ncbi:MAG: shikimate dehydrogenase [Patescibacteria group bacterium]|nr:shikimate dehydrogenase [Patescibacteria group bacterium]
MNIDPHTRLYCVIGNPVEHSLSPALHNAAFQELGLNNVYIAFCVSDVESAIRGFRALGIQGVSVTIPHKVSVIPFLDEIDPIAKNIGAVNTIINNQGKLKGYNSDGYGALKALLDAGIDVHGKKLVILGSGGAARAIAFTLAMEAKLDILSILGIENDQLIQLVKDISNNTSTKVNGILMNSTGWKECLDRADVIIHCTPTGMHPHSEQSIIPQEMLRSGQVVFDIVYTPLITKLLQFAGQSGCITIRGIEMFINQAVFQFELWTGKSAPVAVMRNIVENHLQK